MESLKSADGTPIDYEALGEGPGVLLVHGAMQSAQSFSKLSAALAPSFRVYAYNRRGRGASGRFGPEYGLSKEVEDVDALLKKTGSRFVFGLSSGALIGLHAARQLSTITKLAIYEPPLTIEGADPAKWASRYQQHIDRGELAAAMVTIVRGTGDDGLITRMPRALLTLLMKLAIRLDATESTPHVSIRELIPTVQYDMRLQREATALLPTLTNVACEVLLMGGDRSHPALRAVLDEVARRMPRAKRVRFPKIGHLAADDSGRPREVADALRAFFTA